MDRKIEESGIKIGGETKLRVRYAETDKMGVVYHSNFVIWFEVGRVELLRQLGFQYSDMETEDDCHIPVVDLRVRYKAPAQYDDEIVVRTQIKNVRSSLLHFSYEIFREGDRMLVCIRGVRRGTDEHATCVGKTRDSFEVRVPPTRRERHHAANTPSVLRR